MVVPSDDPRTDELAAVQARRVTRASISIPTEQGARLLDALAEFEGACDEFDTAVARIRRRHDPVGCLPFALAMATAVIVFGATIRSVRWHFSVLFALAGAVATIIVLLYFRAKNWFNSHPMLVEMTKLADADPEDGEAAYERIALSEAIVRHYLPPDVGEPLLARLANARSRAAKLFGAPRLAHLTPPPRQD